MDFNAVEEPIVHYGGCLCTRLYYRLTFPADSEYPIAGHCHCDSCRKAGSSFTSTSIVIPPDCIEFAVRISLPHTPLGSDTSRATADPVVESVRENLERKTNVPSMSSNVLLPSQARNTAETSSLRRESEPRNSMSTRDASRAAGPWVPAAPTPIPTIGPSESSLHSRVWRTMSSIGPQARTDEGRRKAFSADKWEGDAKSECPTSSGDETVQQTQSPKPSDDPPPYETAESANGVEIYPGLKVPWPYREYESSPGVFRGFCSQCSSTMIFRTNSKDALHIKAGTLDDPGKAIVGRFDTELWTSNKFPDAWGINLGTPSELGEVQRFEQNR